MSCTFIAFMPADIFYFAASEGKFFLTSCKIHAHYFCFYFFQITSFLSHSAPSSAEKSDICSEKSHKCSIPCLSSLYFPVFSVHVTLKSRPSPSKSGWCLIHTKGKKSPRINHSLSFYHNILFLLFRHYWLIL